jgi:hypothetical protein
MLFEIEFFRVTEAAPEGATIGRICRDFDSLKTGRGSHHIQRGSQEQS